MNSCLVLSPTVQNSILSTTLCCIDWKGAEQVAGLTACLRARSRQTHWSASDHFRSFFALQGHALLAMPHQESSLPHQLRACIPELHPASLLNHWETSLFFWVWPCPLPSPAPPERWLHMLPTQPTCQLALKPSQYMRPGSRLTHHFRAAAGMLLLIDPVS